MALFILVNDCEDLRKEDPNALVDAKLTVSLSGTNQTFTCSAPEPSLAPRFFQSFQYNITDPQGRTVTILLKDGEEDFAKVDILLTADLLQSILPNKYNMQVLDPKNPCQPKIKASFKFEDHQITESERQSEQTGTQSDSESDRQSSEQTDDQTSAVEKSEGDIKKSESAETDLTDEENSADDDDNSANEDSANNEEESHSSQNPEEDEIESQNPTSSALSGIESGNGTEKDENKEEEDDEEQDDDLNKIEEEEEEEEKNESEPSSSNSKDNKNVSSSSVPTSPKSPSSTKSFKRESLSQEMSLRKNDRSKRIYEKFYSDHKEIIVQDNFEAIEQTATESAQKIYDQFLKEVALGFTLNEAEIQKRWPQAPSKADDQATPEEEDN